MCVGCTTEETISASTWWGCERNNDGICDCFTSLSSNHDRIAEYKIIGSRKSEVCPTLFERLQGFSTDCVYTPYVFPGITGLYNSLLSRTGHIDRHFIYTAPPTQFYVYARRNSLIVLFSKLGRHQLETNISSA